MGSIPSNIFKKNPSPSRVTARGRRIRRIEFEQGGRLGIESFECSAGLPPGAQAAGENDDGRVSARGQCRRCCRQADRVIAFVHQDRPAPVHMRPGADLMQRQVQRAGDMTKDKPRLGPEIEQ